jgi:hypothetical protein
LHIHHSINEAMRLLRNEARIGIAVVRQQNVFPDFCHSQKL